MYKELIRN